MIDFFKSGECQEQRRHFLPDAREGLTAQLARVVLKSAGERPRSRAHAQPNQNGQGGQRVVDCRCARHRSSHHSINKQFILQFESLDICPSMYI